MVSMPVRFGAEVSARTCLLVWRPGPAGEFTALRSALMRTDSILRCCCSVSAGHVPAAYKNFESIRAVTMHMRLLMGSDLSDKILFPIIAVTDCPCQAARDSSAPPEVFVGPHYA